MRDLSFTTKYYNGLRTHARPKSPQRREHEKNEDRERLPHRKEAASTLTRVVLLQRQVPSEESAKRVHGREPIEMKRKENRAQPNREACDTTALTPLPTEA